MTGSEMMIAVLIVGALLFLFCWWSTREPEIKLDAELGTVEIVEIDGQYAVRQYGYYAGYGKPMQIDIDKGSEPFGSGWFCWENRFGARTPITFKKKPEWSYVDEDGHSTGIFGAADAPSSYALWSYEFAEKVAAKAKAHAGDQRNEIEAARIRRQEFDEWREKGKTAKAVKRI
ncbi:hypothetical protein [Fibrobacter sp.]|uniref:hypothetical protein n=1 Tax=Fibrobacter sp. TaxID=35828 RepID=UPI003870CA74